VSRGDAERAVRATLDTLGERPSRQFVREGNELVDRGVKSAQRLRERLAFEVPELQADDWLRDARQIDVEMTPREAYFAPAENVKPKDAIGRVSAELVTPYPPGIPVAAPGEVYNEAIVYYLEEVVAAGGFVEGATDQSLSTLRVVAAGV
jgi:arginine/lysine/ornithine decarboxylase